MKFPFSNIYTFVIVPTTLRSFAPHQRSSAVSCLEIFRQTDYPSTSLLEVRTDRYTARHHLWRYIKTNLIFQVNWVADGRGNSTPRDRRRLRDPRVLRFSSFGSNTSAQVTFTQDSFYTPEIRPSYHSASFSPSIYHYHYYHYYSIKRIFIN